MNTDEDFARWNEACSESRRQMFGLYSDGPWTPVDFVLKNGQILMRRYRQDTNGVRVAFLTTGA